MKLLLAVATFLITVGSLFLLDSHKTANQKTQNYAQVIGAVKNEQSATSTRSQLVKINNESPTIATPKDQTPPPITDAATMPSVLPSQTLNQDITPAVTLEPTRIPTFIYSSNPTPSVVPTPTLVPSVSIVSHVFYTSKLSYPRSKYVYCDTDRNWKDLVNPLSYPSLQEALAVFPNKILHEACK